MLKKTKKGHADASPSSSDIWLNCAASVTKARGLTRKSTPYTREGTAAHQYAEAGLLGRKIGNVITIEGEDVPVTEEMTEAVQIYIDHVKTLPGDVSIETKVHLALEGEDIFGTADAWSHDKGTVYVRDFKYGVGHAVAPDCSQLKIYALGVLNELGPFPDVELVSLGIVQPRIDPDPKIMDIPLAALLAWEKDILAPAVKRLADDDQTETPGEHCRWCVRAASCRSLAELSQVTARHAFEEIPVEAETLTNEELALVLDKAEIIASWVNKIRGEATTRAEAGQLIPGWKLVPKRASRKWADPNAAITALSDLGLHGDDFLRIETITNVEKLLKKHGYKPTEVTEPYTSKQSSGNNLVCENDARKAIDTEWRNVFQLEFVET